MRPWGLQKGEVSRRRIWLSWILKEREGEGELVESTHYNMDNVQGGSLTASDCLESGSGFLLFAWCCLLVNIQSPSFKRIWLCTLWFSSISVQFSPRWTGGMCVWMSVHIEMPSALDSACFQRDLEIVQSFLLTLLSAKGIREGCGGPAWFYLNLHVDPFIT